MIIFKKNIYLFNYSNDPTDQDIVGKILYSDRRLKKNIIKLEIVGNFDFLSAELNNEQPKQTNYSDSQKARYAS